MQQNTNNIFYFVENNIEPLNKNIFSEKNFININDLLCFMYEICKNKYDYINELIDYLTFNNVFCGYQKYDIYNKYIQFTLTCNQINYSSVNDLVIHYTIISHIKDTNKNIQKFALAKILITDKLLDNDKLFEIVSNYIQYSESHPFLKMALEQIKLNEYHFDKIIEKYKNGQCDILEYFVKWGIFPTQEQYCSFAKNKNTSGFKLLRTLNLSTYNNFILESINSNKYPVDGVNIKTIVKLTPAEKMYINKSIFTRKPNASFTKHQISSMQRQFELEFDEECMLDFCINDGNFELFKYLTQSGVKPTVECLHHLIPKFCFHKKVHNILNLSI